MSKSDLIDLAMHLHFETTRAILVSDDGDEKTAQWLPKSQVEFTEGPIGTEITVTMPEWLAQKRGLI